MMKMLLTDALTAIILGLAAFFLFYHSPVRQVGDSRYSLLLSESLVDGHGVALERYLPDDWRSKHAPQRPYQLQPVDGYLFYAFPFASSLLSAPLVGSLKLAGYSAIGPDGLYDGVGEWNLEHHVASVLAASSIVIAFFMGRLLLPPVWSLVVALTAALGSQLWSTLSRAHWSHDWFVILVGLAVVEILAAEVGRRAPRATWLATLLMWAYFVRPTGVIPLAGVGLWMGIRHRREMARFLMVSAAWITSFFIASWFVFHSPLPPYFRPERLGSPTFLPALFGNLVSPARGLLVYDPWIIIVAWWMWRYRAFLSVRSLVPLAAAVVVVHLAVVSSFPHWWGGYCYGPRLTADLIPWLLLLAVLSISAATMAWQAEARARSRMEFPLATGLLALSFLLHATGALSRRANDWNGTPINVDAAPERLWEWRDAPFLAPWVRPTE